MQLEKLLLDATESVEGASQRSQHIELAKRLNAKHGDKGSISVKGVEKWFERGSIPGPWLMRIADLPRKPLNLSTYA